MRKSTSAIVLAAGSSSRMGRQNKLLLSYGGKPLVRAVVEQILAADPLELIVVTGHQQEAVEGALSGLDLRFVHNDAAFKGMTSSIQTGVRAARGEGYMICLSDMYALEADDYTALFDFFAETSIADPACICMPQFAGKRGNPVIFSSAYRQEILDHDEPEGCKGIVQRHNERLVFIEMSNDHVLLDLGTPEAYSRLKR